MRKVARKSQHEELAKAYGEYRAMLLRHALIKTHDSMAADDLVQETFLKAWQYMSAGEKIDAMKAFLFHVLNYLIIDSYRKKKTASLDALLEQGYEAGTDSTEQTIDFLDSKRALEFIKHLAPKYQKVLRMRYVENRPLKEIAQATRQTPNVTAVQLHRGIAKLRRIYNKAARGRELPRAKFA